MEYLKNYNDYSDDLIIEKLNIQPLIDKFKTSIDKKTAGKLIIGVLLSFLTTSETMNFINRNFSDNEKKVLIETVSKYNDPINMSISKKCIEHIKSHEKLKLKAYDIGDGKITVGYGHAESIGKSAFKIGQIISEKIADDLLKKDLETAEDGVKRIFKQWKEQNINIKLTQGQFDAMISMAFNMGVSNLRTSDFIQALKNKNLTRAAELIKTTNIDEEKFPGLTDRREQEYNMFVS